MHIVHSSRTIPETAALLDQQIASLNPEQAWWLDTLMRGQLPDGAPEANVCAKSDLHKSYIQHAKVQGANHRSIETKLGIFLEDQLGSELKSMRATIRGEQERCYALPPLKECRVKFDQKIGQPVAWGEGWDEDVWGKYVPIYDREWM